MVIDPWGPLCLHKWSPALSGALWVLAEVENPRQSVFSKENYRFVQILNSGLGTIETLLFLRYRARIYSGIT